MYVYRQRLKYIYIHTWLQKYSSAMYTCVMPLTSKLINSGDKLRHVSGDPTCPAVLLDYY